MNDLDLRAALHRDADLAGEPPADLLDQLLRRRQDQRRRRAGALGGIAAVVVLAAGIPIGASFVSASHGGPAAPATSPTTEAVPDEVTPTTTAPEPVAVVPPPVAPETPPAAPDTPSAAPETVAQVPASAGVPSTEPDPPCDWTAIAAALPPDTPETRRTLYSGSGELCVGAWAASGYTQVNVVDGEEYPDGQAGLFHHVDGSWTFLDSYSHCDDAGIPPAVWERACNVD